MLKYLVILFFVLFLVACGNGDNGGNSSTNRPSSGTLFSSGNNSEPLNEQTNPNTPSQENGNFFYFSYDDSSSTAARDLSLFAIENGRLPHPSWGRPYEFLNAEKFTHFAPQELGPFSLSMGLYEAVDGELPLDDEGTLYSLGVNISGPTLNRNERPNVVLTLLIDISGSMQSPYASETRNDITTLLDVVKHGLLSMEESLKSGDVVSIVSFDTSAQIELEDWHYGESGYIERVNRLHTQGSTNLNAGIDLAYTVAMRNFDDTKANRVIILTDAYANTGVIDPSVIAKRTVIDGKEGILFAGIGIGANFDDAFLNELTEAGKSVYSAMITPSDAERIFTNGFSRFIDHAVEDVLFKLEYPSSLNHLHSAAEETSQNKNDISTINFAYNSEQLFLEVFSSETGPLPTEEITLEISYKSDNGETQTIEINQEAQKLLNNGVNEIIAASTVTALARLISGETNCATVQSSGLYSRNIDHAVFTKYKEAIRNLCAMAPSL